jgi:hypothetical protein
MPRFEPHTVSELVFWSYANLAMAQDAVSRGLVKYDRTSFMIRSRLFKGLVSGSMKIHSLFDDENLKLANGTRCVYCGNEQNVSIDHLFPRHFGGTDSSDNLVCCCKSCNSSKGDTNMMKWFSSKNMFPPLMILRRYLKLVYQYCDKAELLDSTIESLNSSGAPFSDTDIPVDYPSPDKLKL